MSGKLIELEPVEVPRLAGIGMQASCLHADSLLWCLRALYAAQIFFSNMDDEKGELKSGSKYRRMLSTLRDQVRPLCNGVAPPSVAAIITQIPQIESRLCQIKLPPCAADKTIAVISEKCALKPVEQDLLRFKTSWVFNRLVPLVFETYFEDINVRSTLEIISEVLQYDIEEVRVALSPSGFLSRSRLLTLDCFHEFMHEINLGDILSMRAGLLQMLELANGDYERLVRTMALPIPESGLKSGDFSHLEPEWLLASEYLRGSLEGGY